jgi:hypothetical protein
MGAARSLSTKVLRGPIHQNYFNCFETYHFVAAQFSNRQKLDDADCGIVSAQLCCSWSSSGSHLQVVERSVEPAPFYFYKCLRDLSSLPRSTFTSGREICWACPVLLLQVVERSVEPAPFYFYKWSRDLLSLPRSSFTSGREVCRACSVLLLQVVERSVEPAPFFFYKWSRDLLSLPRSSSGRCTRKKCFRFFSSPTLKKIFLCGSNNLHQTFNLVFCGFSVYCSLPLFLSLLTIPPLSLPSRQPEPANVAIHYSFSDHKLSLWASRDKTNKPNRKLFIFTLKLITDKKEGRKERKGERGKEKNNSK